MIPQKQPPTDIRAFQPLREKTLRCMIRRKFITEYGYSDAVPIAEFITEDLMALINRVSQPYERLQPGQMVWLGVPLALPRENIGRPMRDLALQPIVLTVLTEEDVQELMVAKGWKEQLALRCKRTARLFQEAAAQGTTLPYADVAALYGLGLQAVKGDVDRWEAQHNEHLPHRGRVHGIGPTTSHKAEIVESLLQGKQIPEVARLHNHAIHNVERYYQGYNAVEVACGYCDDLDQIAVMTGLKRHVVEQYYALVEKYRPEKMLKNRQPAPVQGS